MTTTDPIIRAGVIALLVLGAILDFRNHRIPNALTYGGAILGLVVNLAIYRFSGGESSVEGWLVGAILMWIPYVQGGMGAGDVKLLAMAGAWGGPQFALSAALFGAVAGAVIALVLLVANRGIAETLRPVVAWIRVGLALTLRTIRPDARVLAPRSETNNVPSSTAPRQLKFPFGPALAVGGIAALILG